MLTAINMLTDFAGTCIFALVYNEQFFVCLSYLFLIVMMVHRMITPKGDKCSRRNMRYLSGIYSNFYRISLILKRIKLFTLVSASFCLWQNSLGFRTACHISNNYISLNVLNAFTAYFVFEQSNMIDIWINGQKMTARRSMYIICHFLLLGMCLFQNNLAFNLLITNHMVDMVKDILQLFCKDKIWIEYIYKYKPVYLAFTYICHITENQVVFAEIILPLVIVFISAYDTIINYRHLFFV